jgi:lysozyme family protein
MAASSFSTALKYVLIDEGGNDDDPNDHGGRTSRGITQKEYDAWCSLNGVTSGDVWKAPHLQIQTIYKTQYWAPFCDQLPAGLDYVFFDTSVNAGRSRAIKSFQQALGVTPDGMLGQVTMAAIQASEPTDLINKVSDVRRSFYQHLAQFPRYGKGWLSRVDHCQKGALALAHNTQYNKTEPASTESPKANDKDVATTTVSPETSGGTAVASGGLMSILDSFKDSLSNYADTFQYIKYILIGVAVVGLGYSVYGFYSRSKTQAAVN